MPRSSVVIAQRERHARRMEDAMVRETNFAEVVAATVADIEARRVEELKVRAAAMAREETPQRAAKPAKEKAMKGKSVKKSSLTNKAGSGNNRPATRKVGTGGRKK